MAGLLEQIDSPVDLRRLREDQLPAVCQELRQRIIDVVSTNGGHLASSLGVVELTVALHYIFESPTDPIVWDVGNQAYAHKLLTGRRGRFPTLRRGGGLSGFTLRSESEHDPFGAGHASTSISAALGIAEARRLKGERGKAVAVIGDGGMTGGMAFEALNHAGAMERDLVVVLNDNGMFIAPRVGAMSTWLSHRLSGRTFNLVRRRIKEWLVGFPRYGDATVHLIRRMLEGVKAVFTRGILFEGLNFQYLGPVDGHDLTQLLPLLRNAKLLDGPVLVHVHTIKGKGLACAEDDPASFHGVSPFCPESGKPLKPRVSGPPTYSEVFARSLLEEAAVNPRLLAITAAMADGTGLGAFAERYPGRFYDVGIAEEHAVTFAAGLASQGFRPVVAIYSTFLQRAYDQLLHDVCLQELPVTLVLDRAGIVGEDGPTHHGAFDLSYLATLPNLVVMAPADENELRAMLHTALRLPGPAAIRYPRGVAVGVESTARPEPLMVGRGRVVRQSPSPSPSPSPPAGKPAVAVLSVGTTLAPALAAAERLSQEGVEVVVADARFVKPLDAELVARLAQTAGRLITVEENVLSGGFGSAVARCLQERGILVPLVSLGLPDRFLPHGDTRGLRAEAGIDESGIRRAILRLAGRATAEKTA